MQRKLESYGHRIANTASSQEIGRDKQCCSRTLISAGVPVLPTVFAYPSTAVDGLVDELGEEVVLKPLAGYGGLGVTRALGSAAITAALAELTSTSQLCVVQPFASDANGSGQRLITVGGKVVAAYRLMLCRGDFRANAGFGGRVESFVPSDQLCKLAVRAAKACGLVIAGVDILYSERFGGDVVIEVNTNSGWVNDVLATLTGRSVGIEMAAYVGSVARLAA